MHHDSILCTLSSSLCISMAQCCASGINMAQCCASGITLQTLNVCLTQLIVTSVALLFKLFHQLWLLENIAVLEVNTCDKPNKDGNALKQDTTPMHAVRFLLCSYIVLEVLLPYSWLHVTNPITIIIIAP